MDDLTSDEGQWITPDEMDTAEVLSHKVCEIFETGKHPVAVGVLACAFAMVAMYKSAAAERGTDPEDIRVKMGLASSAAHALGIAIEGIKIKEAN